MRVAILVTLGSAALLCGFAEAQSGYVRDSIGKQKTATRIGPSLYNLPFEQWKGEKLVFAPKSYGLQKFGYRLVEPEQPYDSMVGKVVTVTDVARVTDGYVVRLVTDDGAPISTRLFDSFLDDISILELGPVRDIEWARRRWLGKHVWLKPALCRAEQMPYDVELDKWDSVPGKNASAVTVIDVVASDDAHAPVRLIMRTKGGEEGYIDISVMNAPPYALLNGAAQYEHRFFENDPRLKYKWPSKVWAAIEQQKVFVGMTREQARLSWGRPCDINKTTSGGKTREHWVFGHRRFLYFIDGLLSVIRD
jgi:hypothetical protein